MAVTATPIFPQAINLGLTQILPADTTTPKTVFTAGANGSRIDTIIISSTDTAARDVQLFFTRSATNYLLTTVAIAINSGNTNAIPAVAFLNSSQIPGLEIDANGNKILFLKSGDTITAGVLTTVTAAKVINVIITGADY